MGANARSGSLTTTTHMTETDFILTDEQRRDFEEEHARLGFGAGEDSDARQTREIGDSPGPIVFSSSPEESHVPPKLIPVGSIAQLNTLMGVADEAYAAGDLSDRSIVYPESEMDGEMASILESAKDVCGLKAALSDDQHRKLVRIASAYLLGNSEKVRSYEPIINTLYFPGHVAAFSSPSTLIVRKGSPLVIKGRDPVIMNFGAITVEEGAEILIESQTTLRAQVIRQESQRGVVKPASMQCHTIQIMGKPGTTGSNGSPGSGGGAGAAGIEGASVGTKSGFVCTLQPTDGGPGAAGSAGSAGGQGGPGLDAPGVVLSFDRVEGTITICMGGGNGGKGGNGGQGGPGGDGGPPGQGAAGCGRAATGPAGPGGQGGHGGQGGDGGNGPIVQVSYRSIASDGGFRKQEVIGQPGEGGDGGDPGPEGSGTGGGGNLGCGARGLQGVKAGAPGVLMLVEK